MTQDELKQAVARRRRVATMWSTTSRKAPSSASALARRPIFFIDELAAIKGRIGGTVASSKPRKTAGGARRRSAGTQRGGRGPGANSRLCRQRRRDHCATGNDQGRRCCADAGKIVAAVAKTFVCVCDQIKLVQTLGRFPLPVKSSRWPARPGGALWLSSAVSRNCRRCGDRQRQYDHRRAWFEHHRSGRIRNRAEPDRRRGDQRPVRPSRRRQLLLLATPDGSNADALRDVPDTPHPPFRQRPDTVTAWTPAFAGATRSIR